MRKHLLLLLVGWLFISHPLFPQTIYNPKNVDKTATSYFDGQQTFRALEYTKDPDPQGEKVYRLETWAENGFPDIYLRGIDAGNVVYFEDKFPYDNLYDNQSQFLSSEAVQTLYGFQNVMKEFDQRFGWKGPDGVGVTPINVFLRNSDEQPLESPGAHYIKYDNKEYFEFFRSFSGNKPYKNVLEVIAHEYTHAIFHWKTGIVSFPDYLCNEYITLSEGISDIFGIYIKNKALQTTPQNYLWLYAGQVGIGKDFSDPKTNQYANTYNGQYYTNVCTEDYDPHPGGGVAHKWFYLLSTGFQGSAYNDLGYVYSNLTGIGVEKAIQIVWDAMPMIKPSSDYPAFRAMTLQATEKLYGLNSAEYLAVQNAWCAVGVCADNQVGFTMSPANGVTGVDPWPEVEVSLTWKDEPVLEWEVQMSTKYDFSENLQTVKVNSFTKVIDPKGSITYTATVKGYYRPGDKVYARAQITQAAPTFCRTAINPLCPLYQKFGPTHAFTLEDKQVDLFSWMQQTFFTVNPWKDPTLNWKSVNGAQKYTFQVFNDKPLTDLVSFGTVNHTGNFMESGVIPTLLEHGKKYYVRVRALRTNIAQLINNFGAWSKTDSILAIAPPTQVLQGKIQQDNDPATPVSSLGFWVGWDPVPGADNFVIQIAADAAFSNILRMHTSAGNLTNDLVALPLLADQTNLYVRVLPKKGTVYGICLNVWRVVTSQNALLPKMTTPADSSPIAYKKYGGVTFGYQGGTLNLALIDHFELHLTKKTSGQTTVYVTQGKVFDQYIQDQLMFDDKQGLEVRVCGVGPLGAKSGLSPAFFYPICPDQPFPKFPGDFSKVDPSKALTVSWHASLWLKSGDNYLVTILDNGVPVAGFNNAPTTATSMNVPAGTLPSNKTLSLFIKNQGSCPGIDAPTVLFSTTSGVSNNPPAPPTKNFTIGIRGFRNDADINFIPPAFETSDYTLGFELFDPNGVKVNVVDGNGPVSQLLVDSENAILDIPLTMMPVGKYTLKLKMLNIVTQAEYFPFDQPRFSVLFNGQPVVSNHFITFQPLDPASPFNEWQPNFQFSDIIIEVK